MAEGENRKIHLGSFAHEDGKRMKTEVVSLRLVDPKESGLHGFADVKLDAILIKDFRIVQRNSDGENHGPCARTET